MYYSNFEEEINEQNDTKIDIKRNFNQGFRIFWTV